VVVILILVEVVNISQLFIRVYFFLFSFLAKRGCSKGANNHQNIYIKERIDTKKREGTKPRLLQEDENL